MKRVYRQAFPRGINGKKASEIGIFLKRNSYNLERNIPHRQSAGKCSNLDFFKHSSYTSPPRVGGKSNVDKSMFLINYKFFKLYKCDIKKQKSTKK
ncbi:MAG: hypothetical protein LBR79_06360 [Oscillospiraceae bacterium]|nr:hypothetical protein [Oscillospiraceae bacterium]